MKGLKPMARIVVVTSGKGGVGKTTTSASFSAGLALAGLWALVVLLALLSRSIRQVTAGPTLEQDPEEDPHAQR